VSLPLGNPQVPFDPRRNYIFGPYQPSPVGEGNVGLGEVVFYSLSSGSRNSAAGDQALFWHRSGNDNVAVGSIAMFTSETCLDVTAVGTAAVHLAVEGEGTTAIGRLAGFAAVRTQADTALGDSTLRFLTEGGENVAIGFRTAENLQRASATVVVGTLGALECRALERCVLFGFEALGYAGATMRSDNVAVGDHAMTYTQASRNVAVGSFAGIGVTSGEGNTMVGAGVAVSFAQTAAVDNAVIIGQDAFSTGSNQVTVGNGDSDSVVLAGVPFSRADLLALLSVASGRPRNPPAPRDGRFWSTRLKDFVVRAQDQRSKPPVPPVQDPLQRDRRLCLSALLAGAVSACGGGSEVVAPTGMNPGVSGADAERASPTAVTGSARSSLQRVAPSDSPLGSPLVPANPLRNYVFGPNQIQPTADTAMANVGMGEAALKGITTGWANTALGDNAMGRQQSGLNCVALGSVAMFAAVHAIDCTAIGSGALQAAVDGVGGTAIGRLACASLTSANNNTGIGAHAMRLAVSGIGNTAVGYKASESNVEGSGNVAVGAHAARWVPGGDRNVAIGFYALGDARGQSSDNVAVGANALLSATGGRNTAVGSGAGQRLSTGSGNVFIGFLAGADERQNPEASNSIAIGDGSYTTGSNQIVLGNDRTETVILGGVAFTRSQLSQLAALASKIRR
jgi:hypothetical protein